MKTDADVLQTWLDMQDISDLDRDCLRVCGANPSGVFRLALGRHDWFYATPSNTKSAWRRILGARMVKNLPYADITHSDIATKPTDLVAPLQRSLTWQDGGDIALVLLIMAVYLWLWAHMGTVAICVWLLGFYCCLATLETTAKWCRLQAASQPKTTASTWQRWLMHTQQSTLLRSCLCLGLGYVAAWLLFTPAIAWFEQHYWGNASFEWVFAAYLLVAATDTLLNRHLGARFPNTTPATHFELWLYSRGGYRVCYAQASESASLACVQAWVTAQQQAAGITDTFTGRL